MLKTRIITAVILFSAFLSAVFYLPPSGWVVFASLVATVAAWEWGALMGLGAVPRVAVGTAFAFICLVMAVFAPSALAIEPGFTDAAWKLGRWFYAPAVIFWLVVVPVWMKIRRPLPKSMLGLLIGLVVILPTWLALIQLRQTGGLSLLAIMAVV